MTTAPRGLAAGGRKLWTEITKVHELDPAQEVQLLEACRAKDRLDKLDAVLRGDPHHWLVLAEDFDGGPVTVKVDAALSKANDTANLMKQLLAALRLPDEAGKRPQYRGARGAQAPTTPGGKRAGGKVSSLDAARAARSG